MAFANFSLTTAYTAIITALNTQLTAVAGMFKDQTTGDFVGQVRVSSTGKRLESWSGSAWVALDLSSTAITTATNSTNSTTAANATTHIADVAGAVHGAVSTNTANMIVRRDASGNFSAGTITGTVSTATNALSLGGSLAALFAKLASPALTGTPTAPTAAVGTNNTQLATTAFVNSVVDGIPSGARLAVFTASGTFTVPDGVTTLYVTAVAGGGGGGANTTVSSTSGGSGGGGGGCISYPLTVTPGAALQITIGSGGAAGASSGASGIAGGATSIGALLTLGGGGGGTSSHGAGGVGPIGNGGAGGGGNGSAGGGGGGAAHLTIQAPGGSGSGVGGGGGSTNQNTNGIAGVRYGGGGGGCRSTFAYQLYGAAGAGGIAIIEW